MAENEKPPSPFSQSVWQSNELIQTPFKPLTPEEYERSMLRLIMEKPAGHASLEGDSKPVALATPAASKGHEKEHGGIG